MKRKYMAITKEELLKLPTDVQEDVLSTLKVFSECYINFENGRYKASASFGIKSEYAPDHMVIGTAYADDIYTLEERTQNYIEEFHDYPIWYEGERDYDELRRKYGKPVDFSGWY